MKKIIFIFITCFFAFGVYSFSSALTFNECLEEQGWTKGMFENPQNDYDTGSYYIKGLVNKK